MKTRSAPTIDTRRLRHLLRKLVGIYSPSGKEEEVLDYLRRYLVRHGLPVLEQEVEGRRCNLIVLPAGVEPQVALIGHLDTVSAYDLDHFRYEEQGDTIIGLGTADMKGGCAAMIEAFVSLWESGCTQVPAALVLLVGEEEEGDGARKLVREYHFPWALLGEPTDLLPCLSDYGYIELQITTRGKRMHASLATPGQNAIDNMLRLLLGFSRYIEEKRPEVVYNIRDLSSSRSGFAVPDRCDAWLDLHLPPSAPLGEISLEIEEILAGEPKESSDSNQSLRFATIHSGYELPEKGRLVEALKAVSLKHLDRWEPRVFPSHSDANLLWAAGVKPILMGPGQLEKAHSPDEAISFNQVVLAGRMYLDLLLSLAQQAP
jgi:acetylornithine deacetylase